MHYGSIIFFIGYGNTQASFDAMKTYEESLSNITKYELGKRFLEDEKVCVNRNLSYMDIYYKHLIYVLNNINNFTVKNKNAEDLLILSANICIFTSVLPLVLNSPWSSNIFIIIGAVVARVNQHCGEV